MNTKALRQKILDLAIHGKLVPQDPNDEPASVLLERIKAEKERLIKEGKIKRTKRSKAACDKPHYPFELPKGWCWTTVDDIYFVTKLAGFEYTEYFRKEVISPMNAVPIVRAQNVKMGRFIENKNEAITKELSEQLPRSALYKDCLLMTFIGAGVGETCIFHANKRNHLAPNVAKIEPFDEHINMEYALSFFMSSLGQLGVTNISKSTAQASLSMATIRELVIPIPPIKEQSRIANEVAKWFSLIECIEENKGNLQETIKQTKSKILDLAIHGKLVPQDPTDEPASELLKRINPKAEITCDNPQYGKLPNGWCEVQLGDVFNHNTGKALNASNTEGSMKRYLTTSNVYWNAFDFTTVKQMYYKDSELDKCSITKGDLLVCEGGDVGRAAIWNFNYDICIQNHLHRLRPKLGDLCVSLYYYVFYYLKVNNMIGGKGIGLLGLSSNALHKLHVPLPPINEQHRIVAKIEELFTQLDKIEASL